MLNIWAVAALTRRRPELRKWDTPPGAFWISRRSSGERHQGESSKTGTAEAVTNIQFREWLPHAAWVAAVFKAGKY